MKEEDEAYQARLKIARALIPFGDMPNNVMDQCVVTLHTADWEWSCRAKSMDEKRHCHWCEWTCKCGQRWSYGDKYNSDRENEKTSIVENNEAEQFDNIWRDCFGKPMDLGSCIIRAMALERR